MIGIGGFITDFLRKHKLSRNALAETLGYKSKTTIDRLINGSARPDSVQRFEKALINAFSLSDEEKETLSNAVRLSVYGRSRYLANLEIWRFIRGETSSQPYKGIRIVDSRNKQHIDLLARYAVAHEVRLTIVNCQYVESLFSVIEKLLQREGTTAEHFIYVNDDDARTIRSISSLMQVFYNKGYMGYTRQKSEEGAHDCGLNDSDLLIVQWVDAEQTQRMDAVLFTAPDTGVLIELPYIGEDALALAGFDKDKYFPIKRNYFDKSAFEDYIKYSEDYATLEKDHAI